MCPVLMLLLSVSETKWFSLFQKCSSLWHLVAWVPFTQEVVTLPSWATLPSQGFASFVGSTEKPEDCFSSCSVLLLNSYFHTGAHFLGLHCTFHMSVSAGQLPELQEITLLCSWQ